MVDSFQLFRLPLVAFRQFAMMLEVENIVKLSLCSQKTGTILRANRNTSNKVKIEVCYALGGLVKISMGDENIFLRILGEKSVGNVNSGFSKFGTNKMVPYKCFHASQNMHTHWSDEVEGLKAITDYMTNLFKTEVAFMNLCNYSDPDTPNRILNSFRHPTTHLTINYQHREDTVFSLKHLLSIKCPFISVGGTQLTGKDLNQFLKNWMTGESWKIRNLFVYLRGEFDLLEVMSGLNAVERGQDVCRTYENPSEEKIEVFGGFDIRRKTDGKTATIEKPHPDFDLKSFTFIVWD